MKYFKTIQNCFKTTPNGKDMKKKNLVAPGALAQQLQRRTDCNDAQTTTPHQLQRPTNCNSAPTATPHRLQRRTAYNIQNGC